MIRKQRIAPDGSCLFSSIDFCCTGTLNNEVPRLREHVASEIRTQPARYTQVYLGMPPDEYIASILQEGVYGGETEILILAQLYQTTIVVVSLQGLTLLAYAPSEYTTEERRRIYVLYNGQHYDAIVEDMSDGQLRTAFLDSEAEEVDRRVLDLARAEKEKRDLELRTRVRKKIKCSCGEILDTPAAFEEHALAVEHGDDWGFDCEEVLVEEIVSAPNDN